MVNNDNFIKFGPYLLMERVAVGGMAEIWKAKTTGVEGFERIVAIKYILPSHTKNQDFNNMFIEEARVASSLNHNNIARITNFGIIDGKYYHEMEFIDGRSLRQIIKKIKKVKEKIPISSICFTISEVLKGLHYAHNKHDPVTGDFLGIVHRDMSPQNIMISFEGEVKIIDWGVAKVKGVNDDEAGVLKGKFGYMSPEQVEGLEIDNRSDLFSVAIIFYEILSGERLFIADNEINTIKKIKEARVPNISKINTDVDSDLAAIVMKALEKNRDNRYQTAQEFMEDITRYLNKRFPSFTSLELSRFTREMFKEEILEGRRKQSEEELSVTEKLFVDDNKTAITKNKPAKPQTSNLDKTKISKIAKFEDKHDEKNDNRASEYSSKNLAQKNISKEEKTIIRDSDEQTPIPKKTKRNQKTQNQNQNQNQNNKKTSKQPVKQQTSFLKFLLIGGLFLIGYWIYNNMDSVQNETGKIGKVTQETLKQVKNKVNDIKKTTDDIKNNITEKIIKNEQMNTQNKKNLNKTKFTKSDLEKIASVVYKQRLNLTINSKPKGATVIVNGVKKGETPIILKILKNKKINLILRHNDYAEYSKTLSIDKNYTMNLRLKSLISRHKAYISVSVNPPSLIYVNNHLVARYINLDRFKVKAGTAYIKIINKKHNINYKFRLKARRGKHVKKKLILM